MGDQGKLDNLKIEIRSILITYQKGVALSDFRREYYKLIGRRLPSREFGFSDDVELLLTIPDVVTVYKSGGDYHLIGVADVSTQHITKMVGNQKTSKFLPKTRANPFQRLQPIVAPPPKLKPTTLFKDRYEVPPRFTPTSITKKKLPSDLQFNVINLVRRFSSGLKLKDVLSSFQMFYKKSFDFHMHGFFTLKECLDTIPELRFETKNNDLLIHLKDSYKTIEARNSSFAEKGNPGKLINTLDSFENSKATSERDRYAYNNPLKPIPTEKNYSINRFASSEDPVCDTNSLLMLEPDPPIRSPTDKRPDKEKHSTSRSPDALRLVDVESPGFGVSEHIKNYLRKIMQKHPHGIWAAKFPAIYETETRFTFDLHSLGFNDLSAFIDSVPDVFVRRPVAGSRKDWLIYPANSIAAEEDASAPKSGALLVQYVILSTKKILQANSEGIPLDEFLHIYSINCQEPLYIADLGFDSVEKFLISISKQVPLCIKVQDGYKTVFLGESDTTPQPSIPQPVIHPPVMKPPVAASGDNSNDSIPFNAASPDCAYSALRLPANFNSDKFTPVYTSTIINPGNFFIQLEGPDTSEAQTKIYDDMECFYKGPDSHLYKMKDSHMIASAMCAALWPTDKHWYRAKVLTVTGEDTVQVFYVDYGTTENIKKNMLRYLKEEYSKLPAQALKARLAHLQPPKKEGIWSLHSRRRMLEICQDKMLMAKVEDQVDGVLSLLLCDTSGTKDVYINDILMHEGIAESLAIREPSQPAAQPTQTFNSLQQNQLMQMQYLMWQMMQNCVMNPSSNLGAQSMIPAPTFPLGLPQNFQFPPSFAPGASSQVPQAAHSQSKTNRFAAAGPSYAHQTVTETNQRERNTPPSDGDVFGEDDEALFEEFLKKTSSVRKRYVKRVMASDKYVFHILIICSELYVSSGDMSMLIWNNKDPELLHKRLQQGEMDIPSKSISLDDDEQMEEQFRRFHVKGCRTVDNKCSIVVYPLKCAIQILNAFGHPSGPLRTTILKELANYNSNDPSWKDLSEAEIPEGGEVSCSTDDDKLNKLCRYDLNMMRESIRVKKLKEIKLLKDGDRAADHVVEIDKLEQLFAKVNARIDQIDAVCKMFE